LTEPLTYETVGMIELLAITLHGDISPTAWHMLTSTQRDSTRRRAAALVNESADFWERERRKEEAPL
jgi:hypothetical protein